MNPGQASAATSIEHDWIARLLEAPDKAVHDVVRAMANLGYRVGTTSETVARELGVIFASAGSAALTDLVGQVIVALMDDWRPRSRSQPPMCEYFLRGRPWILITCPDDETVRRKGISPTARIDCAICGEFRERQYELLPPQSWTRGFDPLQFYVANHVEGDAHPRLCEKPPATFWARPLLNPRGWNIDWPAIGRRLFEDLCWHRSPRH